MSYTASFRLHHRGHTFSREELALVERLERQRHLTRRVRAVIDDPARKYRAVLHAYLSYIQKLDQRDCILISPNREAVCARPLGGPALRSLQVTPRSYLRLYGGTRRPIGQLILFNADQYCPSLPLYRSRLDAILQLAIPYINGPNSVIIIHGSSQTPKNTRFRHWLKQAFLPASIYLPYSGAEPYGAEASPPPHRPPKIIHNFQFIIYNYKASLPALPLSRAPLKIPA